jgi:hypothetical protein
LKCAAILRPIRLFFLFSGVAESGAVDVLLGVERGEHYRLVMNLSGVLVNSGGGLGAEVAVAEIEVKGADVVGAVIAGELHAALDACDCV